MNINFTIEETTIHTINFIFSKFSNAVPVHSHGSNCYEIHYIPNGYGRLIVDNTPYDIVPNTLYVTGPHINHAQFPSPENPMEEYCLYIKIGYIGNKPQNIPLLKAFTSTPFWFGNDTHNLLPLFDDLLQESSNTSIGYQEKIKALLCQIFIAIVRNYENVHTIATPHTENSFLDNKSLIIEEYFLYEYANLSLEDLANRLNLSTRQTERILKEYYGKNFQQKKMEARMSIAAILLLENNRISYIADTLGFSSLEHFSTAFKKYYQMSPRQYKESPLH